MGYASDTVADKRHKAVELEYLREFYLFWAQFHAICGQAAAEISDKQAASQRMIDQANKLREFYA